MVAIKREIPNHFSLPPRIKRLGELAYNLWWTWNLEASEAFYRIDQTLWDEVNHNAVIFLLRVERAKLNAVANDRHYLEIYDRVMSDYDQYMGEKNTWFAKNYPDVKDQLIAYFSFEFGLHESLPVYAGGLGVLSGDHLKESSDLGIPLVGLGFIYRQGYFSQHVTEDGWQETSNFILNLDQMPVIPLYDEENKPLMISIHLPEREVFARIWEVRVGRISLFLLDSDVDVNTPNDQQLTARLYTSDLDVRISQEILLGIGGVKALNLMGHEPTVWHMNEGHSAFLSIQRIRKMIEEGKSYDEAVEIVRNSNIFTTHTPVAAGIDQFPLWMMDKYFATFWPQLKITREQFIDLGKQSQPWGENFSMPVLAIHLSDHLNAVSELHASVSRRLWHFMWPNRKEENVPISYVTNGVHTQTWMATRMQLLFRNHFGPEWYEHIDDSEMWDRVADIPDEELWHVHQQLKNDMLRFITWRARQEWLSGDFHPVQVIAGGVLLDNRILTIGFARRFATYKRAYLPLQDFDRLLSIMNNKEMPVQFIFSGKAHPADEPGKLIIQQIYRAIKDSRTGGRIVFLEDYDMNIARYLVQGVDVWMNNPRRLNEASGTSGMKAAANGVLNFSISDGWWHEGYNQENGWKIGDDKTYEDASEQDKADAESLYNIMENEIVPLFYKNRLSILPSHDWVVRMKESIRTLAPQFSTTRMVKEYLKKYYMIAMKS
jgi:starch phosphorylase